jgi:hypothetical protein
MNSPIIIFNPTGLTDDQVKLIKQALDEAYRAGYETAKEFYQLKFNTEETTKNPGTTWIGTPNTYGVVYNNCSNGVEKGTYASSEGTYADTKNAYTSSTCPHMYGNAENKAKGICGLCGLSFDEWHG